MTVKELKELLDEMPPEMDDMEIYATVDYGDYNHTQALVDLGESFTKHDAYSSGYSESGLAIYPGKDMDDEERHGEVIVLGGVW